MVAAATSNLCEAANASVQGQASEEKLISSAKQVAASTAQLLVACKVKADQDSEAMRRLQVQLDALSCSHNVGAGSVFSLTVFSIPAVGSSQFEHLSVTDCRECGEEGLRQFGAGRSEGSV